MLRGEMLQIPRGCGWLGEQGQSTFDMQCRLRACAT